MKSILEQLIQDEKELISKQIISDSNGYLSPKINVKKLLQQGYVTAEQHQNKCI